VEAPYLEQKLRFFPDRIEVQATGVAVMMVWEKPIMRRMAEIAGMRRGEVLEVGFGMGLCAEAIQGLRPRSHTIVEAHPEIIERGRAWAAGKPGVRVVAGRWQDVLPALGVYDGIAFDVFGGEQQRLGFFGELGHLLKPAGVATLWLGDAPDLPADLRVVLEAQGFAHHLTRVSAVPPPGCTYSQKNDFAVPVIWRRGRHGLPDEDHGRSNGLT
jgi:spermidine synthase